jgi:hypothetical protein
VKLTELDPRWIVLRDGGDVVGITFRCPHCPAGERGYTTFLGLMFTTTIDRDGLDIEEQDWPNYMLRHPDDKFWRRSGTTFEDLTLSPSIDASSVGHWHGHITNGEAT